MGSFLSRRLFPRAKDPLDTYGLLLESIDAELEALQRRRAAKTVQHRRLIRALLLYSTIALAVLLLAAWAVGLGGDHSRALKVALAMAFPAVVWLLKQAIDRGYERSLRYDDKILAQLQKQREKMLDELLAQTNFHRTQQLIDKFQRRPQPSPQPQNRPPPSAASKTAAAPSTPLRRPNAKAAGAPSPAASTSAPAGGPSSFSTGPASASLPSVSLHSAPFTPPRPAVPGLLPGQPYMTPEDVHRFHRTELQQPTRRSALDKVIDFVLGDGPNNRFALICQSCFSHNGLVRPEEVATIRYRCVVCNYVNSASKLPSDWRPTIHGRTQTAIIQSTPAPHPAHEDSAAPTDAVPAPVESTPAVVDAAAPLAPTAEEKEGAAALEGKEDEADGGEEEPSGGKDAGPVKGPRRRKKKSSTPRRAAADGQTTAAAPLTATT